MAGLGPCPRQRTGFGGQFGAGFQFLYQILLLLACYLFLPVEFLHHTDTFLQNFSSPLLLFRDRFCFVFACLRTFTFKQIN